MEESTDILVRDENTKTNKTFSKSRVNKLETNENTRSRSDINTVGNKLFQNVPNPFNPLTKIRFNLSEPSNLKLIVYDILGREAIRLLDDNIEAGSYSYTFDGSQLPSGIYYYKIESPKYTEIKKMMLIKQ